MLETSNSQQSMTREDLQKRLTSEVMSSSELEALVAEVVANDPDDFRSFAQGLDSTLDEQSDYQGLSFSIGASYTFLRAAGNLAIAPAVPLPYVGAVISGIKLYTGVGSFAVTSHFFQGAFDRLKGDEVSETDKAAAAFDILAAAAFAANGPLGLAPFLGDAQAKYNKIAYQMNEALIDGAYGFSSKFGTDREFMSSVNNHIADMEGRLPSLSDIQQSAFNSLKESALNVNALDSEFRLRIEKLEAAQLEIRHATEKNVFSKYGAGGPRYKATEDALKEAQKALKGENGEPDLATLRDQYADAVKKFNADYNDYSDSVDAIKNNGNYDDLLAPASGDATFKTPTNRGGTSLSDLNFDVPDFDLNPEKALDVKKPWGISDGAGVAGGAANVIGGLAWMISSALDLDSVLKKGDATASEKAAAGLNVASAAGTAIGGALDAMSGLAKFSKFSKALGVAGNVVGAVADLALGAATVVKTFSDPNATDLQKGLAIGNLLAPGFDLLAIEKADRYADMLNDPNLSEADKFAFQAIYKQAILNSIPIFNMFSFIWDNDDALVRQVTDDLIREYGDVSGDPDVLDDGDIFAFLTNSYKNILEKYYEDNKQILLDIIEDLGPEAQQASLIGKSANYSMLTDDPEAKKIYDAIVPEAIRDEADVISKFTLTKVDGITHEELVIDGQTSTPTNETTTDGKVIEREDGVNWRLGNQNNQPDSITANTSIVAISKDYAGDAYLYDDLGIDNTVLYQSTGDRDYGFWLEERRVTEKRQVSVLVPDDGSGINGIGGGSHWEKQYRDVQVLRKFRQYIEGPDGEKNNVDHLYVGLGRDNVIASEIDETLRVTSGDWQDFTRLSSGSSSGADLDRMTLTNSTLKRIEIGNASLADTNANHQSAEGDRRLDVSWHSGDVVEELQEKLDAETGKLNDLRDALSVLQGHVDTWGNSPIGFGFRIQMEQKQDEFVAQGLAVVVAQTALSSYLAGEGHKAHLEDVEMVVLTDGDSQRSILYSEQEGNFTIAMTGGGTLPLYLSDATNAKTYETGSIIGSDEADTVDLYNADRVQSLAVNLKGGNDTLRIYHPVKDGFYTVDGGAGGDELEVQIEDGQRAVVFAGNNAGSDLQTYQDQIDQETAPGIEEADAEIAKARLAYDEATDPREIALKSTDLATAIGKKVQLSAAADDAKVVGVAAQNVETIGVNSSAGVYFHVGGGAGPLELNGTGQEDVYDVKLDRDSATSLTIDDATGPLDNVQIHLTDVSDFRVEQQPSSTPETATRTIITETTPATSSVELASNAKVTLKLGNIKELTYERDNIFGEDTGSEGDDLYIVHGDGDPATEQMTIYGRQGDDQVLLTGNYDVGSLTAMSFDEQSGPTSNNLLSFSGSTDIRDYHNSLQKFYFLNDHFELDRNQIDSLVRDGAGSSQRDLVVLASPGDYQGNGGADVFFVGPTTGGNREFRIKDFSADDTLFFSAQIDFALLTPMREGDDLIITSPFATDLTRTIVVENYFADAANKGTIQGGEFELTPEAINARANAGRASAMANQGAEASTPDVDGLFNKLLNKEWYQQGDGDENERFFGTSGSDHINSQGGSDTVDAGAGDDIVDAGSNNEGGSGYDIVSYHRLAGTKSASAGHQYIDLRGSQTFRETPYGSSTANVINNVSGYEGVIGGHGNDTIIGDDKPNIIYGARGSDVINGNGGDDIIHAGQMNNVWDGYSYDILDGGEGFDIVSFEGENRERIRIDLGAVSVGWNPLTSDPHTQVYTGDASTSSKYYSTISRVQVRNFEGVIGGNHDDEIAGDTGANYLSGANGNDQLLGRAGADTLVGGAGNDTLIGGQGDDALLGGAGADTFTIGGAEEAGTQDTIYDFDAAEDTLDISGTDFTVRMQADQFVFDPVAKTQSFFKSSALISNGESSVLLHGVSAADAEQTLRGKGTVTFALDDSGGTFTDSADANGIAGGAGDDHILGMGGNDTIKVSSGADTLDGGEGFDILDFSSFESASDAGIQYNVAFEKLSVLGDNGWENEGDVIRNFEGVIGSEYRDNVGGLIDAVYLDGRGGDDTLSGGQGNDTILGGAGNDDIRGGNGDDLLTGGTGRDTFQYGGSDGGMDTITDFDVTEDHFYLFFTEPNSFADITITDTQNGVRVEWDTDATGLTSTGAVLQGVDSSQITADHFWFH